MIVDGLHVPVIPLILVVGSAMGDEPTHMGAMALNKGSVSSLTVTVVAQVMKLLHPSVTVQVMVDVPILKVPLAFVPVPLLLVAPVIT